MKIDVRGRVRNTRLPTTRPLLPLFEAVVNSIQSIDAAGLGSKGRIAITVSREDTVPGLEGEDALGAVTGFSIADNGPGFTDANFESFTTADSSFKMSEGGKGIGRFTWLKA